MSGGGTFTYWRWRWTKPDVYDHTILILLPVGTILRDPTGTPWVHETEQGWRSLHNNEMRSAWRIAHTGPLKIIGRLPKP
jgi:hypothetical protein